MTVLVNLFWRLCTFRSGPEDMPCSPLLLALVLVGWLALQGILASFQTGLTLGQMLATQLLAMLVVLVGSALLLAFKGLAPRWWQTALALVGVDIVLALASLPVVLINTLFSEPNAVISGVYLLLVSWQLAAHSFIYHRALQVGPFMGLALAFMFLILGYALILALLPGVVEAAANA